MSPGQRTPDGGYIPVRRESIIITAEQAQAAAARSAVVVVVAILATSVIVCVCVCGFRQGGQSKSQSDTRARRGPAGDARAVVAFLLVPRWHTIRRNATARPSSSSSWTWTDHGGRSIDAPRKPVAARKRARSRHSTGKRFGAETAYSCCCCEPPVTARACTPGPALSLSGRRQMARGAPRNLAWPGPSNHGRVQ